MTSMLVTPTGVAILFAHLLLLCTALLLLGFALQQQSRIRRTVLIVLAAGATGATMMLAADWMERTGLGIVALWVAPVLLGIVIIRENQVGIVIKKFAPQSLPAGELIALNGEAGYQADLLRGGLHFGFWRWQYRIHKTPLVTVPQGKIGYVYARDGDVLQAGQTLAKTVDCNNFQDARAFLASGQRGRQRVILREGVYAINLANFVVMFGSGSGPQPFKTVKDYDNWLERASQVPVLFDQAIANMREQLGLNGTFLEQLARYVGGLFRGDLGKSVVFSSPVTSLIGAALPVTLSLMLVTITFTVVLAVPLAVYIGQHPSGKLATVFLFLSSFFVSTPAFFVGLLALLIFAVRLGIAPVAGIQGTLPGAITYLWLPSLVIAAALVPILARVLIASVVSTLREEFVEVAIVRGVRGRTYSWRYLIRPSIAPTLSLLSYIVGALFASAVVVELVFNLPGVGTLLVNAVAGRDYPLVQGIVLISGVFVVVVSAIGDLITTLIDPRANL